MYVFGFDNISTDAVVFVNFSKRPVAQLAVIIEIFFYLCAINIIMTEQKESERLHANAWPVMMFGEHLIILNMM